MNNKILLILIIFSILVSSKIDACTCIGENSVEEAFNQMDVVFLGKVISEREFTVKDKNNPNRIEYKMETPMKEYSFLIEECFKGKVETQDTIKIITGVGGGDCGFRFSVDNSYIVYSNYKDKYFAKGRRVESFLYTDICTRTTSNVLDELNGIKKHLKKKKSKTLDSLKIKNKSFTEVIDSLLIREQKCWYYEKDVYFRIDLQTYSDTIYIAINIGDTITSRNAIETATGFFNYEGQLYFVSAENHHLIDLIFKKSEVERRFYYRSFNCARELTRINDSRRATYTYFYVNGRLIFNSGYPPCPR